jgi:hypothetical protein
MFFWAPLVAGGPPAGPSTAHTPTWPRCYADTTPSNCALHTDPAQPRLSPPQSRSPRSTGSRPPAPRPPASSRGEQTRRRLSGPLDRLHSAVPTARGALLGAGEGPRAASATHPSGVPGSPRRPCAGSSPPPVRRPAPFSLGVAAHPARPTLSPKLRGRRRAPGPPAPAAAAAHPHTRSRPSPRPLAPSR